MKINKLVIFSAAVLVFVVAFFAVKVFAQRPHVDYGFTCDIAAGDRHMVYPPVYRCENAEAVCYMNEDGSVFSCFKK